VGADLALQLLKFSGEFLVGSQQTAHSDKGAND
jgi:hypothetical protein